MRTEDTATYDADSIRTLRGLEAVRLRPSMYIGSTGQAGVLHLLFEVLQNSVDEAMAGFGTEIAVTIRDDDTVTVRDAGRGIPVGAIELVLTTLHAGGKFGPEAGYGVTGGLHGVGVSCVNALSESLVVEVYRNGVRADQRFRRGEALGPAQTTPVDAPDGTTVTWRPDPQVFGDARLELAAVRERLRELAFLMPAVRFTLTTPAGEESFAEQDGAAGYTRFVAAEHPPVHVPIHLEGTEDGVGVEVGLLWTWGYHEETRSFVNTIRTRHGGTHELGLDEGVVRAVQRYLRQAGHLGEDDALLIAGNDLREGLTAVAVLELADPQFEGQTKTMLSSESARTAVRAVVEDGLGAWLSAHPDAAGAIAGRVLEAARARLAARRAGERARYQQADRSVSKEIYRKQFGIRSANWHDSATWITAGDLLQTHAEMCEVSEDAKVLDICCGSGVVGASFKGRVGHIEGLDLTPEMVALAETRLDHVTKGDVYDIPFPDASFDLVCNREVLHLFPDPHRPVSEVFRVLKPGGQFIFGQLMPYGAADAPWFFRILKKKQPLFFQLFLDEDLLKLLGDAGFENVTTRELVVWEDIDRWIETHETPTLNRHEIRRLYRDAPAAVRRIHPFKMDERGHIMDAWRWVVFSGWKPEA